jgi:hypothetical protein
MRSALISFIAVVGCAAVVGASPKKAYDVLPMPVTEKAASEATLIDAVVPLAQLIDKFPDGADVIGVYQAVRTVRDVEAANAQVKAQASKAQSVVSDVARLHAATIRSCEDAEASQVEALASKARAFSATLVQVDGELTKSLVAMRQKVEFQRSASTRAKEDLNRLVLATLELGRARVQAQEIAKSLEGLAASIGAAAAACTPRLIPPLFAEHTPIASGGAPQAGTPSLPKRTKYHAKRRASAYVP